MQVSQWWNSPGRADGLATRPSRGAWTPGAVGLCCGALAWLLASGSALLAFDVGTDPISALEEAFTKTIELGEPSVVSIIRDKNAAQPRSDLDDIDGFGIRRPRTGFDVPRVLSPDYIPTDFGTGVIIHEEGLILTCYHVVKGGPIVDRSTAAADSVLLVRLADRRTAFASIVAADPRSDLAVIRVKLNNLKPARFGNASKLRKGQFVVALGNPYAIARDGSASASWGIISNIRRAAPLDGDPREEESQRRETIHHLGSLIQVDARLNLGTSGGALLNLKGELIGITTSLAALVGYEKSSGFAVPLETNVLRIVEDLKQGYEVDYGFLGINPVDLDPDEARGLGERFGQVGGVKVFGAMLNGPASRGGVLANDVILSVEDRPVLNRTDLMREIGVLRPGTEVRLRVLRPGERTDRTHRVTIGKWPVTDPDGIVATARRFKPFRGMGIDFATARRRYLPDAAVRTSQMPSGVLVTEVEPNSPAAMAELQPGDFITHINGATVDSPKAFDDQTRTLKSGDVTFNLLGGRRVVVK